MRIIKRKKGKNEYYYIQHSFRTRNKVITREKYLGTGIPKNIEEIKNKMKEEFKIDLNGKLDSIKKNFQKEWRTLPVSIKQKELEEISIAFTYNTNALEGSTITLEETRGIIHDNISPNKSLRDVNETEAHSKIFLEMLGKKDKMSNKLILKWHKDMFNESKPDIAGRYRDYLIRVGDYIAPDWQGVRILMKKFIEFVNSSYFNLNSVELSAKVHYRFEKIHPFGDGNGRIGRLIMNKILWDNGYPMIIIEKKKRKSYYKALKKEEDEFVKYLIRRYLAVHKKRIDK